MHDELTLKSEVSRMGDNRIIWNPIALHERARGFDDDNDGIIVSIAKAKRSK